MRKLLILTVKFYRNYLSPLKLQTCRFYPTCSKYTLECLQKFGITKGVFKSVKRVLKCHPFHPGGYDPVPNVSDNTSGTETFGTGYDPAECTDGHRRDAQMSTDGDKKPETSNQIRFWLLVTGFWFL